MGAEHPAAFHQVLVVNDMEGLEGDRGSKRIAAEGRAVRSGSEDVHDLAARDEGRDRQHTAAERLAQHQAVRPGTLMLEREPGAGAAEAGLDLVEDQEHAIRIAQPPHAHKPARGRNDDARLALDRLDEHRDRCGRDRPLDRGEIAKGNAAKARCERSETVAIVGLG